MRKVAASIFGLMFASSALAGTVSFGGSPVNVLPGETASFQVTVSDTDLASFDSVSLLIGSDSALTFNWEYDAAYVGRLSGAPTPPGAFGVFPTDLNVGGSDFATPFFEAPVLIGTLSIPTQGLAEGSYDVFVSSARENNDLGFALSLVASGLTQETIEGRGTFNVVPEPATLMLLGLGGLAAAFRRRIV